MSPNTCVQIYLRALPFIHFEFAEFLKNQASVDTLEFLIYLFLQQVHKISLRSSLVTGEEYPSICLDKQWYEIRFFMDIPAGFVRD